MEPLRARISRLDSELNEALQKINLKELNNQLSQVRIDMSRPDFWQNSLKAKSVSKNEASLSRRIEPWVKIQKTIQELKEIADLDDQLMVDELSVQVKNAQTQFEELKKELRFQGAYDDHDVILSIHAGAGGTDAQDWAQMLLRMYIRWAEKNSVSVETIDQSVGEEAGIKSVSIQLSGSSFLYGKLSGEHGIHRLVRLSPFNADHLRQTSFAKVEVLPVIEKPDEVELEEKDLKVDVFRAGGHGGQSVNTTDSAVRVTHIPTEISVTIQNERSQLQNKETALTILRSRLVSLQLEQHAQSLEDLKGPNQSAEWGNQIRSYVLHPYKQVKDLRSGYESSEVEKVLNGNLNPLIDAWLEHNISS